METDRIRLKLYLIVFIALLLLGIFGFMIIESLSLVQCLCPTMYRVDPRHLLRTLQCLVDGKVINRIQVDPATAADARLALERMLEIP